MKPSITLGRLFGVDIGLHYSWFIIALVARARGVSFRSITLFALGGVATMENPSPDAKTEFRVAAGPIARHLMMSTSCITRLRRPGEL